MDIAPKKTYQWPVTHEEGCSASPAIREVQIQTTVRCYFTPTGMAAIKGTDNSKCWRGCGETATLIHGWGCTVMQLL